MWPFKKRDPACTLEQFYAIQARFAAQTALEDALLDEWSDGPGKLFPRKTEMMREIEGAPLKPVEVMADGWIPAFYAWAKERGLDGPA